MNTKIAGVDEVGRGCIAGPVVAAAVILDPARPIEGLTDSKKLSAKQRETLAQEIKNRALAWGIARAEPSEIDQINILRASLLAMARAVASLKIEPDWVLVDGNHFPPITVPGETVVQGDSLIPAISAASILAKVARDSEMQFLDLLHPEFEFSRHKGYPTKLHQEKLCLCGITALHRTTFAPVKKILNSRP
ncbi:MAG: ribonuclease HII [Gammaproteobacteria bacterium]